VPKRQPLADCTKPLGKEHERRRQPREGLLQRQPRDEHAVAAVGDEGRLRHDERDREQDHERQHDAHDEGRQRRGIAWQRAGSPEAVGHGENRQEQQRIEQPVAERLHQLRGLEIHRPQQIGGDQPQTDALADAALDVHGGGEIEAARDEQVRKQLGAGNQLRPGVVGINVPPDQHRDGVGKARADHGHQQRRFVGEARARRAHEQRCQRA
jgi:hypothetical protein